MWHLAKWPLMSQLSHQQGVSEQGAGIQRDAQHHTALSSVVGAGRAPVGQCATALPLGSSVWLKPHCQELPGSAEDGQLCEP